MATKRLRHPGGVSSVTRIEKPAGEWSVQVDPDNLLIDTFHKGRGPHVHDQRNYDRRIRVGIANPQEAYAIVVAHLEKTGGIDFPTLLKELKADED